MSKFRQAARVDTNQKSIVSGLRKMGYSVLTGHDDILVGHNGKTYFFEIKDPEKTVKKSGGFKAGAIKDSQIKLAAEWKGHYAIVHSLEQILEQING